MPKFAPAPRTAQNRSGVGLGIRPHDRAVGEHELGRAQVVDGQAVLAGEQADAAGGRESADADAAVVAGAERPAVLAERRGDLHPAGAGADAHEPALRVEHLDLVEAAEVDHDAAVVRAAAADAVPAAADARAAAPDAGARTRAPRRPAPATRAAARCPARRRACRSRARRRTRSRPARSPRSPAGTSS